MKIRTKMSIAGSLLLMLFLQNLPAQVPPSYQTLKICALRVQFQPDENPLTTGNGLFMIDSVTSDPYAIDPAPHNKQYFVDQITAAANYFWKVSHGRLKITGDVFPAGENEAFQLPKKMAAYNPNTTDEAINKGISQLFVDAIKAADQSAEGIDFSQYDLVVVFHAGVGRDIELGYDPTPQDIPSLYLSPSFLKAALGDTFNGVSVNNGTKQINSGILLPETQNQQGYHIALTGFLVSNIGSYLGLYDLFSPSTQKSAIGRFGLMDAGLLNANGLIPAAPCAFSRMLLNWETPVDLTNPAANLPIARLFSEQARLKPTLYRVWLNEDEYYLIECRGDPAVNLDSLYDELAYNRDQLPSYMELLKTHFADRIEIGPSGVLTNVENYDWGLPGSGILIWHVDQRVLRQKGPLNRINDDPAWRAVDLEEADGSQDIGQSYTLLDAGYGKDLGWFADFWFKNRPTYLKDFELYQNEFSSTSRPATVSNWNHAYSHIRLYDFSANTDEVMHFSFEKEMLEEGMPYGLKQPITAYTAIKHQGKNWFYMGLSSGEVWMLLQEDAPNQFFWGPMEAGPDQDSVRYFTALDVDGDGQYDWMLATYSKTILAIPVVDPRYSGPLTFPEWQAPAQILAQPVANGAQFVVSCANDSLYKMEISGSTLSLLEKRAGFKEARDLFFSPEFDWPAGQAADYAALIIDRVNNQKIAVFALNDQGKTAFTIRKQETVSHFVADAQMVGDLALADMDGNGTADIVFNSQNQIFALNTNGTLIDHFPINVDFNHADQLIGSPLIADLDGDGKNELLVASRAGGLLAFNLKGMLLPGFPVNIGGNLSHTPMLLQWDEDSPLELFAVNDSGTFAVWQLDSKDNAHLVWPMANLNPEDNAVFIFEDAGQAVQAGALLPQASVYNYPNPNQGNITTIRYYLNEAAHVTIRIFDLAGSKIAEREMSGLEKTNNEFVWNVEQVPSGVYLCQVEARSQETGKSERRLIKIMVVH